MYSVRDVYKRQGWCRERFIPVDYDADGLKLAIDEMIKRLDGLDFDVIAGAESRGFVFGMPIAYALHKPFVMVRKAGKLPCETVSKTYDLSLIHISEQKRQC